MKKMFQESRLEKEFIAAINDPQIKVVSFDIFETLAFRKTAVPKDIFSLMGEKKFVKELFDTPSTFRQFRENAETQARRKHSNLDEITLEQIYEQLFVTEKKKKRLMDLEIKTETENIYINKQVESWTKTAIKNGKKVILISDTYLSHKSIKKILLSKFDALHVEKIYISCELGKSKAKGTIYPHILEELGIKPKELFHIGDNKKNDVDNAKEKGINTLHYNIEGSLKKSLEFEKRYIQNDFKSNANIRVLSALLNPFEKTEQRFYFDLGSTFFAPLLWEFSHWLHDMSDKQNIEQINFVMREGKLFQRYFTTLFDDKEVNLIYASRKSTLLPSIDFENFKESNINFYTYKEFSIENFYDMYMLEIKDKTLKKYKKTLCKDANTIYVDEHSLLEIFKNDFSARLDEVKENINKQKSLITRYAKSLGVKNGSAIVDFGGIGRSLKQIGSSCDIDFKQYLLFYMHSGGYEYMNSSHALSFLPMNDKTRYAIELIRRVPEFLEILLNGFATSTLSYKQSGTQIVPVTKIFNGDMHGLQEIEEALHLGIDAFFATKKMYDKESRFDRESLALMIARLIEVPTLDEATRLGALIYDEGRGSSYSYPLISKKSLELVKKEGVEPLYTQLCKNIGYKKEQLHWVQGAITQTDEMFLPYVKNIVEHSVNDSAIEEILHILDENRIKKVNIYGAGDFFKKIRYPLLQRNIEILSLIDSRAEIESFKIEGFEVKSLKESINKKNCFPVIISSVAFSIEITDKLLQYAKENDLIFDIINHYNGLIKL
ncbi:HAD-IA family hydrolase [bacterium]|nr:HAD-IA family hydrolase [bacterium]MBU1884211.1 HAD-IA family hydrolase [bacterium]